MRSDKQRAVFSLELIADIMNTSHDKIGLMRRSLDVLVFPNKVIRIVTTPPGGPSGDQHMLTGLVQWTAQERVVHG